MGPDDPLRMDISHPARVWNYWLGGGDNFAPDREAGDRIEAAQPLIRDIALASRAFLNRAVSYLVRDENIAQLIDVGTGLPMAQNTHQVAQWWNPDARIVYVDNDPMVLAHARALLVSTATGRTDYIASDARDTGWILSQAAQTLCFDWPVGLILLNILGHIPHTDEAAAVVRGLVSGLPSDSFVVIGDGVPLSEQDLHAQYVAKAAGHEYTLRPVEHLRAFFDMAELDLDLVDPGLVSMPSWRPDPSDPHPKQLPVYGGVARKKR